MSDTATITMTPTQAEERNGYLTTTGRVSGRPHEIEIWFATNADRTSIYLLSGGGDRADWVRNLDRQSAVTFRAGNVTYTGVATRITDQTDERDARERVSAKYYGWSDGELPNDCSRTALPVVIDLSGEPTAVSNKPSALSQQLLAVWARWRRWERRGR